MEGIKIEVGGGGQPVGKEPTKMEQQQIVLQTIFTINFNQFLFVYTSRNLPKQS